MGRGRGVTLTPSTSSGQAQSCPVKGEEGGTGGTDAASAPLGSGSGAGTTEGESPSQVTVQTWRDMDSLCSLAGREPPSPVSSTGQALRQGPSTSSGEPQDRLNPPPRGEEAEPPPLDPEHLHPLDTGPVSGYGTCFPRYDGCGRGWIPAFAGMTIGRGKRSEGDGGGESPSPQPSPVEGEGGDKERRRVFWSGGALVWVGGFPVWREW